MILKKGHRKYLIIISALLLNLLYLGNYDTVNTSIQTILIERNTKTIEYKKLNSSNNLLIKHKTTSISYDNQSHFSITNDSGFLNFPFISGNGTKNDPYIIDDLNITDLTFTAYLIDIQHTTAHFQINNCLLVGGDRGIRFYNVSNVVIKDNLIFNSSRGGIVFFFSNKIVIQSNNLFNCGIGLYNGCNEINILSNQLQNGTIFIDQARTMNISNNQVKDCLSGDSGVHIVDSSGLNIVNNTINNTNGGILLAISFNALVSNNNVSHSFNDRGLHIRFSKNISVTKNSFLNSGWEGIFIYQSNFTEIVDNIINFSTQSGIDVSSHSYNNTILENEIGYNYENGISINLNADFNKILKNHITENSQNGIEVSLNSHNNTFIVNVIENNGECGINFNTPIYFPLCTNNTLFNNTIRKNGDYGIFLDVQTKCNTIKWNDFINNSMIKQGSQAFDEGIDNEFCYNYWNDWTEPDSNNDGFVDIPYKINGDALNQDPFPLASPNSSYHTPPSDSSSPMPLRIFSTNLIPLLLSICAIGIGIGIVFKIRKESIPSQSISNNKQMEYAFNSNTPTTTITNLDSKKFSLDSNEGLNKRDFPNKIPWLIAIITAIVGFILQIVRPPEVRNLSQDQVMDHPLRREILKILREIQIQHFNGLKRLLNSGTYVLLWHLQVLEDFNLIHCKTFNKIKAYYLTNSNISPSKVNLFCTIKSQKGLIISNFFLTPPFKGWSIKDLCNQTNLNKYAVRYYCKKLKSLGIVEYLKDTREFKLVTSQQQNLLWLLKLYSYKQ